MITHHDISILHGGPDCLCIILVQILSVIDYVDGNGKLPKGVSDKDVQIVKKQET